MNKLLMYPRAVLYFIGFALSTVVASLASLLFAKPLPFEKRYRFVTTVNFFYVFWLRFCCGVKVNVEGRENLPKEGGYVALANHSSEWETIFLQTLIRPQCIVLKRELLKIPFFGWGLAMLEPIAIDRSQRSGALKQLLTQGKQRLSSGVPVVIFPQGTRAELGKQGKFNKGGAMLAASAGVPVVNMAHDAALLWPGKSFLKKPGTITLRISKPVASEGKSVDEIHQESCDWILGQMREMKVLD